MTWSEITELVQKAQTGDREAYGQLVERFQPTVYAVALARLRNPTEAQELTQEVFLHGMKKLAQLRDAADTLTADPVIPGFAVPVADLLPA